MNKKPSVEDMVRDLNRDLSWLEFCASFRDVFPTLPYQCDVPPWQAALRRAIAAEARVKELERNLGDDQP